MKISVEINDLDDKYTIKIYDHWMCDKMLFKLESEGKLKSIAIGTMIQNLNSMSNKIEDMKRKILALR